MFTHDFSHGTIFKKSTWNDWGFIFTYTLNGANAEAWKQRHVDSHHFASNVEHYDSDLEISGQQPENAEVVERAIDP